MEGKHRRKMKNSHINSELIFSKIGYSSGFFWWNLTSGPGCKSVLSQCPNLEVSWIWHGQWFRLSVEVVLGICYYCIIFLLGQIWKLSKKKKRSNRVSKNLLNGNWKCRQTKLSHIIEGRKNSLGSSTYPWNPQGCPKLGEMKKC